MKSKQQKYTEAVARNIKHIGKYLGAKNATTESVATALGVRHNDTASMKIIREALAKRNENNVQS